MSDVKIRAADLRRVLFDISPLLPSATLDTPIGMHLHGDKLCITCLQGCVYQATINVLDDNENIADITILYHDIASLVPNEGSVLLEFLPIGLNVVGSDFSVTFQVGYSTVEEQIIDATHYKDISYANYADGLTTLTKCNLDKLFKINVPILVDNAVSVMKFPNVWIQTRTTGLTFSSVLDVAHVKVLIKFKPSHVDDSKPGVLTFKNDIAFLQIPTKNNNDKVRVVDLLNDLSEPVRLNLEHYLDRLKEASKSESKAHCNISVYEHGLITAIKTQGTAVSVHCGDTTGKLINVINLPVQVWLALLRCVDSPDVEILVGGAKFCIRTTTLVIVARALG